jgi:hypothetical protein
MLPVKSHVILALFLGAAVSASQLNAQSSAGEQAGRVARAVDPRVLRAHLEFLADDALEGRAPGTRGGRTAGWGSSLPVTTAPTSSGCPS